MLVILVAQFGKISSSSEELFWLVEAAEIGSGVGAAAGEDPISKRLGLLGTAGLVGSVALTASRRLGRRLLLTRLRFRAGLGLGCLGGFFHLCLGLLERVLQLKVRSDEVDQRRPKFRIELLGGAGDSKRRRERLILVILKFFATTFTRI